MDDSEIKKLLAEQSEILRALHKDMRVRRFVGIFKWLLILGVLGWLGAQIEPYFAEIGHIFQILDRFRDVQ